MRKTMRSRSHSADSHHLPSVEQQQPQPSPIMQAIALTTVNTNQFKINFTAYNNADQLIELLNWLVAQQDLLLWQEIWSWLLVSPQNIKLQRLSQEKPYELLLVLKSIPASLWNSLAGVESYTLFGTLLNTHNITILTNLAQRDPLGLTTFFNGISSPVWGNFQPVGRGNHTAAHMLFGSPDAKPIIDALRLDPNSFLMLLSNIGPEIWTQPALGNDAGLTPLHFLLVNHSSQQALYDLSILFPQMLLLFFHNRIAPATWAQTKQAEENRGVTPFYFLLRNETNQATLFNLAQANPAKLITFLKDLTLTVWAQEVPSLGRSTPLHE